jgi:hypothetical protein
MKKRHKFGLVVAALALALLATASPAQAQGKKDKDHGKKEKEHESEKQEKEHGKKEKEKEKNKGHDDRDNEEREEHDQRRPVVPPILEPPENQAVTFHAFAVGVQIYTWTQNATNPALFSWVFKAPEAVLFKPDDRDDVVGLHYAGPTWEHKDGSKVVGTVLQRSPSVDPNAIPWLLLQAASNEGDGKFSDVTYIQRVNTVGGIAPATAGDAMHLEARVPYTAEYYFYERQHTAADEVLDWNALFNRLIVTSTYVSAAAFRPAAIVHASMFDAVNGIERCYGPIHVTDPGPRGASRRAAVIQAAYASMLNLFPTQKAALDAQLAASLDNLNNHDDEDEDEDEDCAESVALGLAWGQHVADQIWAWRSTDGFDSSPSTYTGSTAVGKWRPTPTAFANGLFPSLAHTLPWVIPSPSSFRPPGPPALTSAKYTADYIEEKAIGELTSTVRTADQTTAARFWAGTALTFWNRAAASNVLRQHPSLLDTARIFALLNVAMADGAISCWEAKYHYELWRPITAIQLAATDGNPDTLEQAGWTPLIVTPPYPEYSSGHATVTGAAQAVLTLYFGNNLPVQGWSEALGESYVRSWPNFSSAADEANLARIWAGIHWRTAVVDARAAGNAIGAYVIANAAQPAHGRHEEHESKKHGKHKGHH